MKAELKKFQFENHGIGAAAIAAKKIAAGQIVKFEVFNRHPKDCTELVQVETCFFGLMDIDGTAALRKSHCRDLDAAESHSIIPSWNNIAKDPVLIAAALTGYLTRTGSDYFIEK